MDVKSLERSGKVAALRRGGEILLIGPWDVFLGVAPRLLIQDASRLRAVLYPHLRDDSALAKLTTMARQIICMGSVAGHYSPQQALEQMVGLLQAGQISAMTVPDTSGSDENINIQWATLTGVRAGPVSQWPLAERFSYVLERSPYYMSDALGAELRRTFNERTLALVVGTLVVWAGSHAIGIGFVADAALLAIGFSLAGWAIFDGIKFLARFFNLTMNASSESELEQAAKQFADGVTAIGVGALIALLTRGAGRLARRPAGRSMPRPAEETPYTRRQAAGASTNPLEAPPANPVTSGGTANAATAPKLADDLAMTMSKPQVTDPDLAEMMDSLYRSNAKIGSGSTAAAVRNELQTGLPTGGLFHSQKATEYSTALQKWLNANPNASFSDRSAAEHVLRDMQNALKGN